MGKRQDFSRGLSPLFRVTIATTDDDAYPSGWRYALHYGTVDGETLLRYDNAHEESEG